MFYQLRSTLRSPNSVTINILKSAEGGGLAHWKCLENVLFILQCFINFDLSKKILQLVWAHLLAISLQMQWLHGQRAKIVHLGLKVVSVSAEARGQGTVREQVLLLMDYFISSYVTTVYSTGTKYTLIQPSKIVLAHRRGSAPPSSLPPINNCMTKTA